MGKINREACRRGEGGTNADDAASLACFSRILVMSSFFFDSAGVSSTVRFVGAAAAAGWDAKSGTATATACGSSTTTLR
jgi:hypothetical protein